ncbi:hypothetical protein [Streptomyces sp. NPDC004546]|uniref:hypothetical protein n=1 Tax=Streptomyces sp. NPDC004546 TaxID=3154282 RepID=UPI0033A16F40
MREHLADTGLAVLRALTASGRATVAPAYVDDATGSAPYDFLAARALLAQPAPGGAGTRCPRRHRDQRARRSRRHPARSRADAHASPTDRE